MRKEFINIMNNLVVAHGDTVPPKYRNQANNYKRHISVIKTIQSMKMSKGLDFGCGLGSCCVLGKLMGLDISGVDVPSYGMKRNRQTKIMVKIPERPSRYVDAQKHLISMGYKIHIMDTTQIPWSQFSDGEFEFITCLWSINKQFMNREWDIKDRIRELARITKKGGVWFIRPGRHANSISIKHSSLLEHVKIQKV